MSDYNVIIKSGDIPTRSDAVELASKDAVDNILQTHSLPEAVAKVDYIKRVLDLADKKLRKLLLPKIVDIRGIDAYGLFTISADKARAKYDLSALDGDREYQALKLTAAAAVEDVKDYERRAIQSGKVKDLNKNEYTIVLRERKLTNKPKGER